MLELAKLLLPTDFSERSRIVAQQVGALARHFHSEVTLLHVTGDVPPIPPPALPRSYSSAAAAAVDERTAAVYAELNKFAVTELDGVLVKRLMCAGDAAKVIVEQAHIQGVGLICMPTLGRGALRHFLLGSVTAKVLHDAECPVFTGAHMEQNPALNPTKVRHVICAVDFGPQTPKTLRWAADYAAEFGARLTAVHVIYPSTIPERYTFQWHEEVHAEADERVRDLLLRSGISGESLIVSGDTPKALATAVREWKAGLLVIGRRPASGAAGRLGSDAYGIICHCPCPVVSI